MVTTCGAAGVLGAVAEGGTFFGAGGVVWANTTEQQSNVLSNAGTRMNVLTVIFNTFY